MNRDPAEYSDDAALPHRYGEIENLCTEFERQFRLSQRPDINAYLRRVDSSLVKELFLELVALEMEYLSGLGESNSLADYVRRFPENADLLHSRWQQLHSRSGSSITQSRIDTDVSDTKAHQIPHPTIAVGHAVPVQFGRYQIEQVLGTGGFGTVYRAIDPQLQRTVAIKVPHQVRNRSSQREAFQLHEARVAAQLKHPGLVAVYDVQQNGESLYIVQEFVDGQDLSRWAVIAQPNIARLIILMIEIVEAVGYAHQRGMVHRDLKPANILVDHAGGAHVADFGLALNESWQQLRAGETSGTPAYMSPEQVRGESHRLDGRSDLWSLGVVLYELLAGRRPFLGESCAAIFDEILHRDPKPLRMIRPELSAELERITLKCLAKQATNRYGSAAELVDDLSAWVRGQSAAIESAMGASVVPRTLPQVLPKGLRSFDEQDADFFLDLLPGPRNRHGLPESIQFWKTRIETTDSDNTFAVGVIYGPSGCGKSSLIKAGLLPRLAPHVIPVYVEATPEDTTPRLLRSLHRCGCGIPADVTLVDALAGLRTAEWISSDHKILIVLDQFEQWLHAQSAHQDDQLVQALRHCDGGRVQCIVLVRDDFWLAASRFMQSLEIRSREGENSSLVDLFDTSHARHVLWRFGHAYGRLPADMMTLSHEQSSFLDTVVNGLEQDGKVICVRLALLAEMLKAKPWTIETLAQVGGLDGLGVTFLEETFSVSTAPAAHRYHRAGAQAVLKALLPEAGTDIKGSKQSYDRLLEVSGYSERPGDFADVIQILDNQVRLITPTDLQGEVSGLSSASPSPGAKPTSSHTRHYQLTHDFLVPSLREWLTRKQRETRRGRAEIGLAEQAALWSSKPARRHVPSLLDFIRIHIFTASSSWTETERQMMIHARRMHAWRTIIAIATLLLLLWGGFESYGRVQADNALTADPANLAATIQRMWPWQLWARHYLRHVSKQVPDDELERQRQLHARIGLMALTRAYDPELAAELYVCKVPYIGVIRDVLEPHREQLIGTFWTTLHDDLLPSRERFRAGVVLASYASESDLWSEDDYRLLAWQLVRENPIYQPVLWRDLRPVGRHLVADLERLFAQDELPESQQIGAANALAAFAGDDLSRLARLLSTANAAQYEILMPFMSHWSNREINSTLKAVVDQRPTGNLSEADRVALGKKRAGAAISLIRFGDLRGSQSAFIVDEDPESLTQFVHRCRARGVTAGQLVESLENSTDVMTRFGVLLALGDYSIAEVDASQRDELVARLAELYRVDPSSAIHSATGWLLERWNYRREKERVDHTSCPYDRTGTREWFVMEFPANVDKTPEEGEGAGDDVQAEVPKVFCTFVVFQPHEFTVGSALNAAERQADEGEQRVRRTRPIAVSACEVNWAQFDLSDEGKTRASMEQQTGHSLSPAEPAMGVSWFEAVRYCRWLTRTTGMPESEQCFDDETTLLCDADGNPEQWPVHLDRRGFRLPTEAEWEDTCRCGLSTTYGFGSDTKLLSHYGWFMDNSEEWMHEVGQLRPNLRGLFDVHGNVYEWCCDWYGADREAEAEDPLGPETGTFRVFRGGAWYVSSAFCRAAVRLRDRPVFRSLDLGFRVVIVPSAN